MVEKITEEEFNNMVEFYQGVDKDIKIMFKMYLKLPLNIKKHLSFGEYTHIVLERNNLYINYSENDTE